MIFTFLFDCEVFRFGFLMHVFRGTDLFSVRRMCGNCANISEIKGLALWMKSMLSLYQMKEKW